MKKNHQKISPYIIINLLIFVALTILFAVLPKVLFMHWLPINENEPGYAGNFTYVLHDICPCHDGEDDCSGYYACGPDKANITYNLDNAPANLLTEAKIDNYLSNQIETNRQSANIMRIYLLCDASYLLSFLSLVAGIIYFNHTKATQ